MFKSNAATDSCQIDKAGNRQRLEKYRQGRSWKLSQNINTQSKS